MTRPSASAAPRRADEHAQREEQLRLQEAERRARVEGEMRINEERMRLEMQHKKKHSPVKAVVSVAGILVADRRRPRLQDVLAAPGGAGAPSARARAHRGAERARSAGRVRGPAGGIEKDMNDKLASAKSEEERAEDSRRGRGGEGRRAGQAAARAPRDARRPTSTPRRRVVPNVKGKREISDNPARWASRPEAGPDVRSS